MSSREFNQNTGQAKKMAEVDPVIVTDRGRPTHVLMSFEAYQRLVKPKGNLMSCFAPDADEDGDLTIPRFEGFGLRPVDLD